jgi:hypothetical protein
MRILLAFGLCAMLFPCANFAQDIPLPEKIEETPRLAGFVGNEAMDLRPAWVKPGVNYGSPVNWSPSTIAFSVMNVPPLKKLDYGERMDSSEQIAILSGKWGKMQNFLTLDIISNQSQKLFPKDQDEIVLYGRAETGLSQAFTFYTGAYAGSNILINQAYLQDDLDKKKPPVGFIGLTREKARNPATLKTIPDNFTLWMWSADGLRLEKMISGIEHLAGLTDPVNNKVTALVRKDGRDVAVTLDVATMKLLQQTTLPALPK